MKEKINFPAESSQSIRAKDSVIASSETVLLTKGGSRVSKGNRIVLTPINEVTTIALSVETLWQKLVKQPKTK